MGVMVVRHHVDAKTLGKQFAEIVRARDLPVDGIWVRDTEALDPDRADGAVG
jgi:hypothetical protein